MRSLACLVILVAWCLTLPGCALFGKKSGDGKTPPAGGGTPPAKFPTNSDPLLNGGNVSQAGGTAVLAGRVIDNYSRPPANTSIRLVSVDGKEAASPQEVNVDANGYFTVMGLKSGSNYKLLARGKNGDHVLAGITYTRAPNLTVVIQVKEDFANAGTPDVQGSPAFQNAPKTSRLDAGSNPVPTMGLSGTRGSDFEMPAVHVPVPGAFAAPPAPVNQAWVPGPNIASDKGTVWPPPLDIPNPTPKPAPPPLLIPKAPAAPMPPPPQVQARPGFGDSLLDGPARVPSCVLVGTKLVNLALNDVNGEPWEFKTQRRGKLVLFDFWSTTCIPCRKTMPALRHLQAQYGSRGLEVVGIAIESGGGPQELAFRVNKMAQREQLNYRQLLSTSPYCPVRTQFRVEFVPTTVLVDQNGLILWQWRGEPDRQKLDELDRLIQRELSRA